MTKTSLFPGINRQWFIPLIASVCLIFPAVNHSLDAQEATLTEEQSIVVTGEEVPSAYGAFAQPFFQHNPGLCVAAMVIFLRRTFRGCGVPPWTARLSFHSRDRNGFAVSL